MKLSKDIVRVGAPLFKLYGRRIGTFFILDEIIENYPDETQNMLAEMIIFSAQSKVWVNGCSGIKYIAFCKDFRNVDFDEDVPKYNISAVIRPKQTPDEKEVVSVVYIEDGLQDKLAEKEENLSKEDISPKKEKKIWPEQVTVYHTSDGKFHQDQQDAITHQKALDKADAKRLRQNKACGFLKEYLPFHGLANKEETVLIDKFANILAGLKLDAVKDIFIPSDEEE